MSTTKLLFPVVPPWATYSLFSGLNPFDSVFDKCSWASSVHKFIFLLPPLQIARGYLLLISDNLTFALFR